MHRGREGVETPESIRRSPRGERGAGGRRLRGERQGGCDRGERTQRERGGRWRDRWTEKEAPREHKRTQEETQRETGMKNREDTRRPSGEKKRPREGGGKQTAGKKDRSKEGEWGTD